MRPVELCAAPRDQAESVVSSRQVIDGGGVRVRTCECGAGAGAEGCTGERLLFIVLTG